MTQSATMAGPEGSQNVWVIRPLDSCKTHYTDKIIETIYKKSKNKHYILLINVL